MALLFPEMEENKGLSLKIKSNNKDVLSKNQKLFNTLTKKIETLENEIIIEGKRLDKLLQLYAKKLQPYDNQIAQAQLNLAATIDKATLTQKFTKKQLEQVGETIVFLCDEAFSEIIPDSDQEALYDKWADVSYKEELDMEESESKEMFSEFVNSVFGSDFIDPEDFDASEEGFRDIEEKIKARLRETQQEPNENRKKTAKQKEKENVLKAEEELKNKSIRSIYIALAKVLHPDTETDLDKKAEKEELMKKVTVAYEQKDLNSLLRLELEWIHKTSSHLDQLTEDKLKIYIASLKQQVEDLQNEKMKLYYHPRYMPISDYISLSESYAVSKINKEAKTNKVILEELNQQVFQFSRPNSKKEIIKYCKEIYEDQEFDLDDIWNGY